MWKLQEGRLAGNGTSYEHFWLIRPKLEAGIKNREGDRHWPSSDCSGPIAAEVWVQPPGLVAVEVVHWSPAIAYGLAIVSVHIQHFLMLLKFIIKKFTTKIRCAYFIFCTNKMYSG